MSDASTPNSYRALCSDYYVNQRLKVKMDLPDRRDTVLSLFDRVRRELPTMDRFRRYPNELALESTPVDGGQKWLTLRRTSVRSGVVNPETFSEAYRLHRLVLQVAPYFLDVSPIDIEYIELLFGFDLLSSQNHDAIVYDALLAGSPLESLGRVKGATPVECQPLFGVRLDEETATEALFEVKTRSAQRGSRSGEPVEDPISVYLTIRRIGPVQDLNALGQVFDRISSLGELLVETKLIPTLLVPIRDAIVSGRFE